MATLQKKRPQTASQLGRAIRTCEYTTKEQSYKSHKYAVRPAQLPIQSAGFKPLLSQPRPYRNLQSRPKPSRKLPSVSQCLNANILPSKALLMSCVFTPHQTSQQFKRNLFQLYKRDVNEKQIHNKLKEMCTQTQPETETSVYSGTMPHKALGAQTQEIKLFKFRKNKSCDSLSKRSSNIKNTLNGNDSYSNASPKTISKVDISPVHQRFSEPGLNKKDLNTLSEENDIKPEKPLPSLIISRTESSNENPLCQYTNVVKVESVIQIPQIECEMSPIKEGTVPDLKILEGPCTEHFQVQSNPGFSGASSTKFTSFKVTQKAKGSPGVFGKKIRLQSAQPVKQVKLQVITPKSTGREVVQIERKVSNITPKQVVFQQVNQASIHEPSKQESITEDISLTVKKRFQLMDKHSNLTLLGNAGKLGSCDQLLQMHQPVEVEVSKRSTQRVQSAHTQATSQQLYVKVNKLIQEQKHKKYDKKWLHEQLTEVVHQSSGDIHIKGYVTNRPQHQSQLSTINIVKQRIQSAVPSKLQKLEVVFEKPSGVPQWAEKVAIGQTKFYQMPYEEQARQSSKFRIIQIQ